MKKTLFLAGAIIYLIANCASAQQKSKATFEPNNSKTEISEFVNYGNVKKVNNPLFDHTHNGYTHHSIKLTPETNELHSLAKSFLVKAGDTIYAEIFAKYSDHQVTDYRWPTFLSSFFSTRLVGSSSSEQLYSVTPPGFQFAFNFLFRHTRNEVPKAYLNFLIYDDHFKLVDGGFAQITEAAREDGRNRQHEKLSAKISISKPGYAYVYVSHDQSSTVSEVYFDDFAVTQLSVINLVTEGGLAILTESGQNIISEQ